MNSLDKTKFYHAIVRRIKHLLQESVHKGAEFKGFQLIRSNLHSTSATLEINMIEMTGAPCRYRLRYEEITDQCQVQHCIRICNAFNLLDTSCLKDIPQDQACDILLEHLEHHDVFFYSVLLDFDNDTYYWKQKFVFRKHETLENLLIENDLNAMRCDDMKNSLEIK